MIVAIVGPSGVGKTTLARALSNIASARRIVTYTTRSPRPGEVRGKDYHFVNEREFSDLDRRGVFIETNEFDGARYGVPASALGKDLCIVVVTLSGVMAMRSAGYDVFMVLVTASNDEIEARRMGRDRDDDIEDGAEDLADIIVENHNGAIMGVAEKIRRAVMEGLVR